MCTGVTSELGRLAGLLSPIHVTTDEVRTPSLLTMDGALSGASTTSVSMVAEALLDSGLNLHKKWK